MCGLVGYQNGGDTCKLVEYKKHKIRLLISLLILLLRRTIIEPCQESTEWKMSWQTPVREGFVHELSLHL